MRLDFFDDLVSRVLVLAKAVWRKSTSVKGSYRSVWQCYCARGGERASPILKDKSIPSFAGSLARMTRIRTW